MKTLLLVDGIDGAGKSTLIAEIVEQIFEEDKNYKGDYSAVECYAFPSRMPTLADKKDILTRTFFYLNDFHQVMRNRREDYVVCDRSFVTTMAYQGFRDQCKEPLQTPQFESIFRLGAASFVSNDFTNFTPKNVFFLHVRCNPEEAASRIMGRNNYRVGDIENITDKEALVERLATLQDRLDLCYSYLRMSMKQLFPLHHYTFMTVDSTENSTEEVSHKALNQMRPILWPSQKALHFS